jgi:hypothetical protein
LKTCSLTFHLNGKASLHRKPVFYWLRSLALSTRNRVDPNAANLRHLQKTRDPTRFYGSSKSTRLTPR